MVPLETTRLLDDTLIEDDDMATFPTPRVSIFKKDERNQRAK